MSLIHLYTHNYNYKIQPISDKVLGEPEETNTTINMKFLFEGSPYCPLACWYRIQNLNLIG